MDLICSWCKSKGKVIGNAKSFPGVKVAKCTKCHHEWEVIVKVKQYNMKHKFLKGDMIHHKVLGDGIVIEYTVLRIRVKFNKITKWLMHNYV